MKRRLLMAKAMVHAPRVLVLDEPTAGVDIELRQQLWSTVRELNKQGTTILLTTHYLEEAEELCDEIAIINQGQVIACEKTEDLLKRIDNKEIIFRLEQDIRDVPKALSAYCAEIRGARSVAIRYSPGEQKVGDMVRALEQDGLRIDDISTDESDLEDVFCSLPLLTKSQI